jgi:hypothetical protein
MPFAYHNLHSDKIDDATHCTYRPFLAQRRGILFMK